MNAVSTPAESHCRHSVILGHNNIPSPADINERNVNCIRSCADGYYTAVIRMQNMIRVAKQNNLNRMPFCNLFNDFNNRAGICINIYFHIFSRKKSPAENRGF